MIWTNEDLFLLNKLEVVVIDIFNHKTTEPIKQEKKEFRGTNRYVNSNYKLRRKNNGYIGNRGT
jgi:hypothetical protein